MNRSIKNPGLWAAGILTVGLVGFLAWLWHLAVFRDDFDFLDSRAPAEWILFPAPPDGSIHVSTESTASFRHSFVLESVPAPATLSVRAMKHWTLVLNGTPIEPENRDSRSWKRPAQIDVSRWLRPGTNQLVVAVANSNGPPALWLALKTSGTGIVSGPDWTVTLGDSVECKAARATDSARIANGNVLGAPERPGPSFLQHLPLFLIFAALSCGWLVLGRRWVSAYEARGGRLGSLDSSRFAITGLVVAGIAWVALFANNLRLLPFMNGFDTFFHLQYIDHIRRTWTVAMPGAGWQSYQPPLYYLVSGGFLDMLGAETASELSTMALRCLGLCLGILHFTIVFLSLRLLFPERWGVQFFGLILAALLPENIYIAHYVTNELLAATLVSGSLYLCLLILIQKRDSWRMFVGLGLCLGAALLAKVTAIIAVPFIALALAAPWITGRQAGSRKTAALKWLVTFLACGCVCGWYYLRIWRQFGSPLIGNWDLRAGYHWWMDPGFRTSTYFFRFGACLAQPWYSGLNGFADGLYSTLWGDGLFGGMIAAEARPPWNYELMAASFLLALLPTFLILAGAVIAVIKFVRAPDTAWFLLIGLAISTMAALVYMNLKIPSYGQAKSFYGLIAMLPLCAFGCLGWTLVLRCGKRVAGPAAVLFGIWAMASYGSFWIRAWAPETKLAAGAMTIENGRPADGLHYYDEAIRRAPGELKPKRFKVAALLAADRVAEASAIAQQMLLEQPDAGESHLANAWVLATAGNLDQAAAEARVMIRAEPDNSLGHQSLCEWLSKTGHDEEVIAATREALRVEPFNPELHYYIGAAFAHLGRQSNAVAHLRAATIGRPSWPEAHDELGSALRSLQSPDEAIAHFVEAIRLNPNQPAFRYHLASSLASQRRTAEAIEHYRFLLQLTPDYLPALNDLAWIHATNPDAGVRDGRQAVQLASRACELSQHNVAQFMGTLAAAYAEAGRFDEAIAASEKAIELARRDGAVQIVSANEKLLQLFRSKQPYHEDRSSP